MRRRSVDALAREPQPAEKRPAWWLVVSVVAVILGVIAIVRRRRRG